MKLIRSILFAAIGVLFIASTLHFISRAATAHAEQR